MKSCCRSSGYCQLHCSPEASCQVATGAHLMLEQFVTAGHTWASCIMLQHTQPSVLCRPSAAHMEPTAMRLKSMRLSRIVFQTSMLH